MSKELEIYIHIPFCVQKCRYCDFLSGPADNETKERYMEALCQEISEKSAEYNVYRVTSVFIGGGTPTVVRPEWIERVMELLKKRFHIEDAAGFTI